MGVVVAALIADQRDEYQIPHAVVWDAPDNASEPAGPRRYCGVEVVADDPGGGWHSGRSPGGSRRPRGRRAGVGDRSDHLAVDADPEAVVFGGGGDDLAGVDLARLDALGASTI
jgi:hypothetical protein